MKIQEHITKYLQILKSQPVKKKTVFYHAYRTKIMSGNPYAIFTELMSDRNFDDFEHYWLYSSEEQLNNDTFQRYSKEKNVHYVKDGSNEHMEALATCEFLIDNAALPNYWVKRDGQIYINTWHGTPLKSLGMEAKDSKYSAISNAQRNFLMCDYMVMPNKYTIEKILDSYDCRNCPERTIIDAGYPRNDLVLNADRERVKALLEKKIDSSLNGKKIILYAPTFRSENGRSMNTSEEVFQKIDEIMQELPKDYVMFFKVHNTLGSFFAKKNGEISKYLLFDEIETNELLSIVDVLITDYSSIFFDYLCTRKPIIFFAYDRKEYEGQHGMYINMDSLPGPVCYSSRAVLEQINEIRRGHFKQPNQESNTKLFAYNDDGNASRRVVDIIFKGKDLPKYIYSEKKSNNKKKEQILISMDDNIQPSYLLLLKKVLDKMDMSKTNISIATIDKDKIKKFCEQYYPEIQILLSPVIFQPEDEKEAADYLERQRDKYFYKKEYSCYYNLKPRETEIDYVVSAFKNTTRKWFLNEDDYTKKTIRQKKYNYETIEIIRKVEYSKISDNNKYRLLDRKQVLAEKTHKMTTLVLAGFDSMNYPLEPCIKELQNRGYDVVVLTKDVNDKVNNKVFIENGIGLHSIYDADDSLLSFVDVILTVPTRDKAFSPLIEKAIRNNIFIASFSMLFSSIVMKTNPDVVFILGESKYEEFQENYLTYNCIATGNPQYDKLLPHKRKRSENINKVLIVDQGGYPYGQKGKKQLADTLTRIATMHPDMQFDIKPRYLPGDTSTKTHNVSEHLYDYIKNAPKNLHLMTEATILEDVVINYDAMITTWSTAYLDALVLNIPIILIEGLDSIDVFDVRKQRIDRAYNQLKLTGCVHNYNDLGRGNDEFRIINQKYADREVYNTKENSTTYIVDILIQIYEQILKKGKSIDDKFACTAEEFTTVLSGLKTVNNDNVDYINKRLMRYYTNGYLQRYVYTNRCMGYALDLSSIIELIENLCTGRIYDFEKYYDEAKHQMIAEFRCLLDKTFECEKYQELLKTDAVLQSYYLQWLAENGGVKKLKEFKEKTLVPQCYYYNLAVHYEAWNKILAYKYLFKALDIIYEREVSQTVLDRRLGIDPFKKGLINKVFFYATIILQKKYYLLNLFNDEKINKNAILCMMRMRYNNNVGKYDDNIQLYTNFESIYSKSLHSRRKRRIKGKIRMWIKKKCFKEIRKQYKLSKENRR